MNKVACEAEEVTCEAKETAPVNVPVCPAPSQDAVLKFLKFIPSQNPVNNWGSESGWTGSDKSAQTWPTPPATPLQGDLDHPPSAEYSGEKPQEDQDRAWIVNTPGDPQYFHFLIPDPVGRCIVAPYLRFQWSGSSSEIQAMYGKDYKIHAKLLQATPVDYFCPPLTPLEITLLDPEGCCASAVNKVLREYAPIDLIASIQQYHHYRDTQYSIQSCANQLRRKELQYLEKAMEVLSGLENANIAGRIMAHNDVMMKELADTPGAIPHYLEIVKKFEGEVTKSAADTTINPLFSRPRPSPPSSTQGSFSYPKPPWLRQKAKEHDSLSPRPPTPRPPPC